MFRNWFTTHKTQPNRKPSRSRLHLEALEDRRVPATLLGLTSTDRLVRFDSATPGTLISNVAVSGLPAGENLVSIDTRPATGVVYALSNKNLLYTLNPYTGVATQVAAGPASFALTGARIGIDFNPTVDRLRVVSQSDLNFRINPSTGAIVDGDGGTMGVQPDTALAYAASDTNQNKNPYVSSVAYDRNFQGASLTTLFAIDSTQNVLVRIGGVDGTPSPNLGQLTTLGTLGVNPGNRVGFDIDATGTAYAAMTDRNGLGVTRLYTVNLTTGAATMVGKVGTTRLLFDGLTTLSREEIVYGVTQSNRLVSFRASTPGQLLSATPLLGILSGETIRSIDFRPASDELFALTSMNRILSINTATGQTTQLGAQVDTGALPTAPAASAGIDFNPTVDRLRIVNANDVNLRYNPLTYAAVDTDAVTPGIQGDTNLAYIATDPNIGQNPNIVEVAYDRNDNDGGTATTLFGIDSTLNNLVRQGAVDGNAADVAGGGSPNGGLLTTIGANMTGNLGVDPTDNVGFDISDNGTAGNGAALAVMQLTGDTVSKLFTINLNTGTANQPQGAATLVGTVGGNEVLVAMAISPPTILFSTATFTAKETTGVARITLTRTGGSASTASVRFDTVDGTAFAGVDYTAIVNMVVVFNPGETTKTVNIVITKDRRTEPRETVNLTLASVTGGRTRLGSRPVAVLTISDK